LVVFQHGMSCILFFVTKRKLKIPVYVGLCDGKVKKGKKKSSTDGNTIEA